MRKEILTATCSHLDDEGSGIIHYKGSSVKVPYLLEGETATIQITKGKDVISGRLVDLKKKSADRVIPPCPYYYSCGGCQLQQLSKEGQNHFKQAFCQKYLGIYGPIENIQTMENPYTYRNKSHTTYAMDRGAIISGIYESKSHRVTAIDNCLIQNPKADAIALSIRSLLPSFKLMPFDEDSGQGFLRHVLIRVGHYSGQIMVVLVAGTGVFPSKNNFVKKLMSLHPEITTLVMNINKRKTSMVLGSEEYVLYGKGFIEDSLLGLTFKISPKSFYQVNTEQTEKLYTAALTLAVLSGKERVLDTYCGIGTIGLLASKNAKEVVGVELNPDAIKDAAANAKANGIKNARFIKADAGDYMMQAVERKEKFDLVILDPPRSGSDQKFLTALISLSPKTIVYVSCNPATQARDLKTLTTGGYKVTHIQPVDLFPQTYHVECVVKLEKR